MFPVVVIGAVVEHRDEQWQFVIRGNPECPGVEHQVAVGLQVHKEPAGSLMRQRGGAVVIQVTTGATYTPKPASAIPV
jgi:hypothetical protein